MTLAPLTESTRSALWAFDEPRYFGHRVFAELAGRESWTGLFALSVFGRRLPPELCAVLDEAVAVMTLADPRIWPLKLTRVVGAYGGMVPAFCAGLLAENEARIGPWACVEAARALLAWRAELGDRTNDPERVRDVLAAYRREHRFVAGFGTPYRSPDERVVAFRPLLERRGRTELPHFRTLEAVRVAMKETTRAEVNIGGVLAAVLLDMELAPSQIGAMVVALAQHMFLAHALESSCSRPSALRELAPDYVVYRGREPRSSPRAHAVSSQAAASERVRAAPGE